MNEWQYDPFAPDNTYRVHPKPEGTLSPELVQYSDELYGLPPPEQRHINYGLYGVSSRFGASATVLKAALVRVLNDPVALAELDTKFNAWPARHRAG